MAAGHAFHSTDPHVRVLQNCSFLQVGFCGAEAQL